MIGLVVELFVAIVLLHAGYYSLRDRARAHGRARRRRDVRAAPCRRTAAPPRRPLAACGSSEPALIGLATLVLVVVALRIRHAPSYFIFQTGDMGGYVNSANILTAVGQPFGTQPHGFTLFLRETNLLLGKAHTVAGLPGARRDPPARRDRVRPHAPAARRRPRSASASSCSCTR